MNRTDKLAKVLSDKINCNLTLKEKFIAAIPALFMVFFPLGLLLLKHILSGD